MSRRDWAGGWTIWSPRTGINGSLGFHTTRVAAIRAVCLNWDRLSYEEAEQEALMGRVLPGSALTDTNRKAWRQLRRKYDLMAIHATLEASDYRVRESEAPDA